MPLQLLSTKLSIPPLRSRLITRPRLIEKLNQGLECGFVLVSAPAGYGKTTLLTAWLDQVDFTATWLSLDEGDNDPTPFLAYLAAALRGINLSIGKNLEIPPKASPLPAIETLLTPLVMTLLNLGSLPLRHAVQPSSVSEVPEPSTLILLASGLAAAAWLKVRSER